MQVPKSKTLRDRPYLDWLRGQPCIITHQSGHDNETVDPAHISAGGTGAGMKPADNHALPLIHSLHSLQHQIGETTFWHEHMTDELMMSALVALAEKMHREHNE